MLTKLKDGEKKIDKSKNLTDSWNNIERCTILVIGTPEIEYNRAGGKIMVKDFPNKIEIIDL